MIRIVDYGLGNIQAFLNVFKRLGVAAGRAAKPNELFDATKIILPGVGHFDYAMQKLNYSGMRTQLEELVLVNKIPILGVCVGMQMLAEASDEGVLPGLNWIPGRVKAFDSNVLTSHLPKPHMGWNDVSSVNETKLLEGLGDTPQFYFLHSYYFEATHKQDVAATANYGFDFEVVVASGNIYGVQCHPEKSHHWGELLIRNFSNL